MVLGTAAVASREVDVGKEIFPGYHLSVEALVNPHTWGAEMPHLIDLNQIEASSSLICSFSKTRCSLRLFMSPRSSGSWQIHVVCGYGSYSRQHLCPFQHHCYLRDGPAETTPAKIHQGWQMLSSYIM